MTGVKVYGADWCGMTRATLAHLDSISVPYEYINIEKDRRAREWVARQNGGKEKKPTVKVGGRVLTTPSDEELDAALREAA